MTIPSEVNRVERLMGLCKLWGAVKYFYPYLAYREDIDWDAALVNTIPKVKAVADTYDYATAVQGMLAALDDPITRVIHQEAVDTDSHPRENQPSFRFTPDRILVVTIHNYQNLSDFFGVMQKLAEIKTKIPKADGILFDLRAATPVSHELREIMRLAFQSSEITTLLTLTPLITAGERTRMHIGFVPQVGGMGFPYTSAFQVVDGRRISPAHEAREIPIVFLINRWSVLPPEALALQIARKAAIFVEGNAGDASLGVKTHPIALSDGVETEIRLGELINEDGSGGFLPDKIIPPPQNPGGGDQGLTAALELLKNFKLSKMERTLLPAHAAPRPENAYPEMAFPPLEYRLLAAFRIWTVINYFFPYKNLIEKDWDSVLREFIPRMEQADSALSYHLAVAEMVTHIHDSHGFVASPILKQYFGTAWPPIRLQIIEDAPVVTTILDEESAKTAGLSLGDLVLTIDGENAMERIADRAKYKPASTPQSLMLLAAQESLAGPEDSQILLTVCDHEHRRKEVQLPRKAEYGSWFIRRRSGEVVRQLTDEIGYVDLDRLEVSAVDKMFEKLKDTKGIIFDMRGFPDSTLWAIAPRLTEENGGKAALFERPFVLTPEGSSGDLSYTITQPMPFTEKWRYQGITVMLIDERAMSRAEHTGLLFEAANGTKFIGSPTAGANGDQTNFCVPGEIIIMFTGQAAKHADGRQLQRIGLVPDIAVRPTVVGIQNGRDEVIEAGLEYLQREIEAAQQKN